MALGIGIERSGTETHSRFKMIAKVHRFIPYTTKDEDRAVEQDMPCIEWHPTKRLASAPSQPRFTLCFAGFVVGAADTLDGMGVQIQFLAGTSRQCGETRIIKPGTKRTNCLLLNLITIIPAIVGTARACRFNSVVYLSRRRSLTVICISSRYPRPKRRGL